MIVTPTVLCPPQRFGTDRKERKVGLEVEFAAVSAQQAAAEICAQFGGRIEKVGPHQFKVAETALGDFATELDARFVKLDPVSGEVTWVREMQELLVSVVGNAASIIVPCEIISPPIKVSDIPAFDELLSRLAIVGARGTGQSMYYAFGLHINPEVARTDPEQLLSVMRTQYLLSGWLKQAGHTDITRTLTGFAQPYPDAYGTHILKASYAPSMLELINDYLHYNPSRDRELDMLPLFAWLDEKRISVELPNEKIRKRPTFHYRLPNAGLGEATWSIAREWNRWVLIEMLAEDPHWIGQTSAVFERYSGNSNTAAWCSEVSALVIERLLLRHFQF